MTDFNSFSKWALSPVIILFFSIGAMAGGADTCLINDDCLNAITISNVISDQSYVCIDGCNEFSSPDPIVAGCQMGDFPTVWYQVTVDAVATVMNIEVHSADFESPSISLFKSVSGCNSLELVNLTNGNLACIIGADGVAKAIGTHIDKEATYYIAVSSVLSIGGDFELCVSTIAKGSYCVLDRDLQVVERSNGGPLEGPFDPAEKVRICMNVNSFTASNNGCQWFQGIVPSFGNGWDPSSYDAFGQPYNPEVNNKPIGEAANGVYGASTWDWFNNVGYHHTNSRLNIGDFDNNGTVELCNGSYEIECQSSGGVTGGCCGPCWSDNQGDILPPGWFSYGINGTCPDPGPPIRVDWGDGNTCGGSMGPWSFCFDLVTRDTPDCLGDSTKNDLTLGFYTFSDGEVGSWTGGQSVCALDQPLKLSLKALCGRVTYHDPEPLPTLNSEDIFTYQIHDREVANWEWNISPYWAMPHIINNGQNGVTIENQVLNTTTEPVEIKIIFIGHEVGTENIIIRKVHFLVNPWTTSTTSYYDDQPLKVFPNPANNSTYVEWPEGISEISHLTIYNAQGIAVKKISGFSPHSTRQEIDLQDFSNGLYFLNLVTRNRMYKAKLIKY